jgi:hypothetical protein
MLALASVTSFIESSVADDRLWEKVPKGPMARDRWPPTAAGIGA